MIAKLGCKYILLTVFNRGQPPFQNRDSPLFKNRDSPLFKMFKTGLEFEISKIEIYLFFGI